MKTGRKRGKHLALLLALNLLIASCPLSLLETIGLQGGTIRAKAAEIAVGSTEEAHLDAANGADGTAGTTDEEGKTEGEAAVGTDGGEEAVGTTATTVEGEAEGESTGNGEAGTTMSTAEGEAESAETNGTTDGGDIAETEKLGVYELWIGNTKIISWGSVGGPLEGTNYSYDQSTNTLTLKNATIEPAYDEFKDYYGIYIKMEDSYAGNTPTETTFTLVLEGENVIQMPKTFRTDVTYCNCSGINFYGGMDSSDPMNRNYIGSLSIKAKEGASLTIEGVDYTASLAAEVDNFALAYNYIRYQGLEIIGDLVVESGIINVEASSVKTNSLFSWCGMEVMQNFTMNGGEVNIKGMAAELTTDVTVTEYSGNQHAVYYEYNQIGCDGVWAGEVNLNGGSLTVEGPDITVDEYVGDFFHSRGITPRGEVNVDGGLLKVSAGTVSQGDQESTHLSTTIKADSVVVEGETVAIDGESKEFSSKKDPCAGGHAWSEAYSKNTSHHWHECENSDCPISEDSLKGDYAAHSYTVKTVSAATLKAEADCTQAAEYYYSCICGEVSTTETFTDGEALSHSWGDWKSISDSQYQRVCAHDDSHTQTVTLSAIGEITLNLSPKGGEILDLEPPSIEIGAVSNLSSSAETGTEGAETVDASQETKAEEAEETGEAAILADFLLWQGWQLKPLNGDWEEVKMPLTLEEKHMGGSLRYTLKGDWGEKHSKEVAINPEGLWVTGIEPLTYTGSKVTQSFQLYDGDTLLQEKVDYTLTYKNNQKAYESEGSLAQNGTSSSAIAIVSEGGEALSLMSEGNSVSVTDVSRYNTKTAPRVVVKMKGNYKGTYTIYFPIAKPDLREAQADDLTVTWTGKDQKPVPVVTWEGKKLTNNKDYTIEEYQDKTGYTEAGDHTLTLKGKGNYKGSRTIKLTITRDGKQIAMDKVKVSGVKAQPFSPEGAKQAGLVVKYKNTVLTEKTADQAGEYTVSYLNNHRAGAATLVLTGTGEDANGDNITFKGVKKVVFKVNGTTMSKLQVSGLKSVYDYTGEELCPTDWYPEVAAEVETADTGQEGSQSTAGQQGQNSPAGQTGEEGRSKVVQLTGTDPATGEERLLVEGEDYEVSYQNNVNKGTATIFFTGKPESGFTGVLKKTFKIQARIIMTEDAQGESSKAASQEEGSGFVIRITDPDCTTTGEEKSLVYQMPYTKGGVKPAVTVTYKGKVLTQGTDYKVSYQNNKTVADTSNVGKVPAIVVIGKGNYQGTATLAFAIIPKDVGEGSSYAGQVQVVAKDKIESSKTNGWKQSFTVVDQDGKALKNGTNAAADYTARKAIYTIDSLPATADSAEALENLQNLQKLKEEGTDLTTVPEIQLPAGTTVRVTLELTGSYSGTVSGTYRILAKGYDISKATIKIKAQEYTGKEIFIDSNEDFEKCYIGSSKTSLYLVQEGEHEANLRVISYEKNIQKGTAKVTFVGIGEYGGTKTVSFKIGQRSINDFWAGIFNGVRDLLNG